jgi:hypothetical protein
MAHPLRHLAQELSPYLDNPAYVEKKSVVEALMAHANNPAYPLRELVKELETYGFRFFARKVVMGYYDEMEQLAQESHDEPAGTDDRVDSKSAPVPA